MKNHQCTFNFLLARWKLAFILLGSGTRHHKGLKLRTDKRNQQQLLTPRQPQVDAQQDATHIMNDNNNNGNSTNSNSSSNKNKVSDEEFVAGCRAIRERQRQEAAAAQQQNAQQQEHVENAAVNLNQEGPRVISGSVLVSCNKDEISSDWTQATMWLGTGAGIKLRTN